MVLYLFLNALSLDIMSVVLYGVLELQIADNQCTYSFCYSILLSLTVLHLSSTPAMLHDQVAIDSTIDRLNFCITDE